MMRRVDLTDKDLQLAEQACRALANGYRMNTAERKSPVVRDATLPDPDGGSTLSTMRALQRYCRA